MSNPSKPKTNAFEQDGRLKQVEYAINTVKNSSPAIGIKYKNGVILATQKHDYDKLLKNVRGDKIFKLDNHIYCIVSGLTADANYLIEYARSQGQKYYYTFNSIMPVEQFVEKICDLKHSYTQFGGMRPFGTSFIYAGYEKYQGFKLFSSDPAGNISSWKAVANGKNEVNTNEYLQRNFSEDMDFEQAKKLAIKTLMEGLDSNSPNPNKFELMVLTKNNLDEIKSSYISLEEIKELIENAKN